MVLIIVTHIQLMEEVKDHGKPSERGMRGQPQKKMDGVFEDIER